MAEAYILKTGFAGFQNPQTIWNFPQKDCLRTRKLSILQCVLELKSKLLPTLWPIITNYHQFVPIITNYHQNHWFTHFCCKILLTRFTSFFCRFFETEKQTPQICALLECMGSGVAVVVVVSPQSARSTPLIIFKEIGRNWESQTEAAKLGKIQQNSSKIWFWPLFSA